MSRTDMWERPTQSQVDTDPFEIPMFVTSVDIPPRTPDADSDDDVLVPTVDPALLPRQGTGTWPNGERAVRLGNAEEILITLPANPFASMDVARNRRVVAKPIRGLRVQTDSRRDGDFEVSWKAALRAPVRWRPVSLRLYASPSLNVTVMTIVPDKARKISSRSFVRVGLRAARELGRHIEKELAATSGRNN